MGSVERDGFVTFGYVMGLRSDGKTMVASVQKAQILQRDNSDGKSNGAGAATMAVGWGWGE